MICRYTTEQKINKRKMFAEPLKGSEAISSSQAAKLLVNSYESLLSLRISLQRPLDLANKLPVLSQEVVKQHLHEEGSSLDEDYSQIRSSLKEMLDQISDCLGSHFVEKESVVGRNAKKRAFDHNPNNGIEIGDNWKRIFELQQSFEPFWKATLNKWHSRMHFGSEKGRSQLTVFNLQLWDQIEDFVSDENRILEKSALSLGDSERLDVQTLKSHFRESVHAAKKRRLSSDITAATPLISSHSSPVQFADYQNQGVKVLYQHSFDNGLSEPSRTADREIIASSAKISKVLDLEVYDDRSFYSLLLKAFITSHSSSDAASETLNPADLASLRRCKAKKHQNVDRKASKGRKIRYTVHSKIQNFMFPVPSAANCNYSVDSERLFQSLFQ